MNTSSWAPQRLCLTALPRASLRATLAQADKRKLSRHGRKQPGSCIRVCGSAVTPPVRRQSCTALDSLEAHASALQCWEAAPRPSRWLPRGAPAQRSPGRSFQTARPASPPARGAERRARLSAQACERSNLDLTHRCLHFSDLGVHAALEQLVVRRAGPVCWPHMNQDLHLVCARACDCEQIAGLTAVSKTSSRSAAAGVPSSGAAGLSPLENLGLQLPGVQPCRWSSSPVFLFSIRVT